MDFNDLRMFVKVARYGSFSSAADHLHIAQSALSRRIGRLEHQLGMQLLVRHGRGTELTKEGGLLAQEAERLFDEFDRLQQTIRSMGKEPSGLVRIAMTPIAGQFLGSRIASSLKTSAPKIELVFIEGTSDAVSDWIKDGNADIGVLYSGKVSDDFDATTLIEEPLYLVTPHQNSGLIDDKRTDFPLSRLKELPLVLPDDRGIRRILDGVCERYGFPLKPIIEVSGLSTSKGMIEAGTAYSVLPFAAVYNEVKAQRLRAIPLDPPLTWFVQMVSRTNRKPSLAISTIKRTIVDEVPALLETGVWRGKLVV
jgi:LysR family transcriptional regulator, nitrogen assimilation regulatory protein